MTGVKDYYEILEVARNASDKEIKSAFRRLARRHHPDANPGDPGADRRFKEIGEAHDVLSDPEKRKLYDRYGADWEAAKQAGAGPAGGWTGGPGGGARYQTIDPQEFERLFGGEGGFGGLFGSMFGGGSGRPGGGTGSVEAEGDVEITLREAYGGTARKVRLPDGRTVEVKVPAGVQDGTVLRVPGLRARVRVAADHRFSRSGKDVTVGVEVPLRAALLGGEVEVPTLKGGRVRLTVPPETQNGKRLRLRGLGMPDPKGGAAGDLYAEVRVRLPLPLDEGGRAWAAQQPE